MFFIINNVYTQQKEISESMKITVKNRIDSLNKLIKEKGFKWTAGITPMSYLTDEEFSKMLIKNAKNNLPASKQINIDTNLNLIKRKSGNKNKPLVSFNYWEQYMGAVGQQMDGCNNCVAFAGTGAAEGLLNSYIGGTSIGIKLSETDMANNGCGIGCGGVVASGSGLYCVYSSGIISTPSNNLYPNYDHAYWSISSCSDVSPSIANIKYYLQFSPVVAQMEIYQDFKDFKSDQVYIYIALRDMRQNISGEKGLSKDT